MSSRYPSLPGPGRWWPSSLALRVVLLTVVVSALSSCSGDGEPGAPSPLSGGTATAEPDVALVVTTGTVTGRLAPATRATATERVGAVVDAWFEAAYLGEFPRRIGGRSFPGFDARTTTRAVDDAALTSNGTLADRLEHVRAVNRRVIVDVLAVDGRAVAATARIALGMRLTGVGSGGERQDRLTGRLLLTSDSGAWRVFGYDLARGTV